MDLHGEGTVLRPETPPVVPEGVPVPPVGDRVGPRAGPDGIEGIQAPDAVLALMRFAVQQSLVRLL
jgi:hypothetical protein